MGNSNPAQMALLTGYRTGLPVVKSYDHLIPDMPYHDPDLVFAGYLVGVGQ
jgi:hypothetical protein